MCECVRPLSKLCAELWTGLAALLSLLVLGWSLSLSLAVVGSTSVLATARVFDATYAQNHVKVRVCASLGEKGAFVIKQGSWDG